MTEKRKLRMLTGTATEQERKGVKGWELRGRRNGTAFRQWFRTKGELEDFDRAEYDRRQRIKRGLPESDRPVTFKQLVQIITEQEAPSRWRDEMLAYPLARFGNEQVRRIRSREIGKWITGLEGEKTGKPLAGKTKQHILGVLRAVLERGVVQGYLDHNPARAAAVKAPHAPEPVIQPFKSWAEVYAVARAAGERHGPMIRFACATGLRPEEYLALTGWDINVEQRECRVRRVVVHGVVKETGKTPGSLRTVQLNDQAIAALAALPEGMGLSPSEPDRLVFPSKTGGHQNLNNIRNRIWKKAVAEAADDEGKPLNLAPRRLYQTRHTFATFALATGATLEWVSEQLGHSDTRITMKHYGQLTKPVHDRNLALLNAAWNAETAILGVSETCQAEEAK